ncbi:MAG TPA: LysE family translocator [Anaerolineales bacterium]|jgi:threonine/homoserine/homoserine lactone efflux protein
MLNLEKLPLFVFASIILLLTPGPAVLYIIARSIDQGRAAGLVSVLSIEVGNFFHAVAASLGLSALLLSSPTAFNVVKYLGAAYLVYLGLRQLFSKGTGNAADESPNPPRSLRRIFTQGVTVAVLNPKTALFFLAFLPQFVDRTKGPVSLQFLALGILFVLMAVFSDGMYALLASSAGQWLKSHQRVWLVERYVAGIIYIGLGVTAALASGSI